MICRTRAGLLRVRGYIPGRARPSPVWCSSIPGAAGGRLPEDAEWVGDTHWVPGHHWWGGGVRWWRRGQGRQQCTVQATPTTIFPTGSIKQVGMVQELSDTCLVKKIIFNPPSNDYKFLTIVLPSSPPRTSPLLSPTTRQLPVSSSGLRSPVLPR